MFPNKLRTGTHRGLLAPQHATVPQRIPCDASLQLTSGGQCLPLMAKSNLTTFSTHGQGFPPMAKSSLTMNLLLVHLNKTTNIAKFCSQSHEDRRNAEEKKLSPNKPSLDHQNKPTQALHFPNQFYSTIGYWKARWASCTSAISDFIIRTCGTLSSHSHATITIRSQTYKKGHTVQNSFPKGHATQEAYRWHAETQLISVSFWLLSTGT